VWEKYDVSARFLRVWICHQTSEGGNTDMRIVRRILIGDLSVLAMTLVLIGCMSSPPGPSDTSLSGQETTEETLMAIQDSQQPDASAMGSNDNQDESSLSETDEPSLSETDDFTPQTITEFSICMAVELGARVTQNCVNTCASCVTGNLFNCTLCGICAGVNGVQAARTCKRFLSCGC
jgi:hypothetical protein